MRIAYFILNRFDYDSRARLEIETLRSQGYDIEIIATVGGEMKSYLGCPIHRISQYRWPSKKGRFVQYNLAAASIGRKLKADIYHAVDLDTLYAAFRASLKTGGKLVYEARELYTELEALTGRRTVRSFWEKLERKLIKKTDTIFTINGSIADELVDRYRIERPEVIRNVAPKVDSLEPIDLRFKLKIPADHRIIIYQGVLRNGQGLPYLVEVMKRLEKTTLVFFGDGLLKDRLKNQGEDLGISERVKFAGMIHPDELLNHTAAGDAGVLLMEDVALNNRLALPQKLFQYLSAGLPQIVSPMPEIAGFVEREKTGAVLSMNDPDSDAKAIMELFADSGRFEQIKSNCRYASETNNWEIESKKLIDIYARLGGDL
ncbi:MAG: glycosyltransferase [candidate division Zixibacteria bacterium]